MWSLYSTRRCEPVSYTHLDVYKRQGCGVLDGFKGFRGGVLLQIPTCENVGGGLGFNLLIELAEGFGFVVCYCLSDVRVSLGVDDVEV